MDKREKIRAILTDFSGSVPMSDFRRARIGKTTDEIMALIEAQPAGELVEAARELREIATKVSDQLSDGGVTEAAHTELALALDRIATALKEPNHD